MRKFFSPVISAFKTKIKIPGVKDAETWLRARFDVLLIIPALVVLAAGLFRIEGKKMTAEATAPNLVFTQWWQDELESGTLESLITEFEGLHPDIKITLDTRTRGEIRKELLNYTPPADPSSVPDAKPSAETGEGDSGPGFGDILALDLLWVPELTANGVLDPQETPAPLLTFFYPLFYNISILEETGFSRPPKTRSEFLSYAKAVADPEKGRYAIALALNSGGGQDVYRDIAPWIWASGALVTAGKAPVLETKPAAETLDFLAALGREKLIHPRSSFMNGEEKREAFIGGRIAFMTGPVQDIEILRREMGESAFGFTTLPVPDSYSGKPVFGASSFCAAVSRRSAYPEDARIFAAFLAEKAPFLAEKLHAVPGAAGNPPPSAPADSFYSKAWDLYTAGDLIQEAPDLDEGISGMIKERLPEILGR
jgi:multiple sugar transport system substrate-binding protein